MEKIAALGWFVALSVLASACGNSAEIALSSGRTGAAAQHGACVATPTTFSVSQCMIYARSGFEFFQNCCAGGCPTAKVGNSYCCDAVDYGYAEIAMNCQLATQIARTGRDPYLR